MSWAAWLAIAILFSIAFSILIGAVIAEGRREAPVDTYRRLLAEQDKERSP